MTEPRIDTAAVAERAVALFNQGWNCAEATAAAVGEVFAPGAPGLPRAATCLGGGLGRRGESCGAVVGALVAAGLARGREPGEGDTAKDRAYALATYVVEGFREKFGALLCRELTGVDLSEPAGLKAYKEQDLHHKRCAVLVAAAAALAAEALTR